MKRINTILWSEEPPENTNTLWLNDGILYYYNDGWEAISDISKYIESLAKSADRITAASNKIFSVNNMLSNNADLIVSNVQKLEDSSSSISQSTEILATVSQQLTDSAEDVINGANTIKNSADALQTNADKVGASATAVEQASESLDATKQAFEMLSSEWADDRQAIATALTNRRYPTEPSESFHAMADKITNMSYEEGWFAKIGYTDENDGGIKDAIDYAYELAKAWNPDGSTAQMFRGNKSLKFLPIIDTSNVTNMNSMFSGCTALTSIPQLDTSNVTDMGSTFSGCTALRFIKITNLGKSKTTTYDFSGATNWGTDGEESRQSLIDSLITYSYDRASNGMPTATIKLSANTKALLTEEEIAQITAKGFSLA